MMAKPGPRSGAAREEAATAESSIRHRPSIRDRPSVRHRMVEAAVETLKAEGFAGASARAIAQRGGFNQALVFYHFGSVNDLLLAALDATSERRMERYREAAAGARDLAELVNGARHIFQEDLASGHLAVLAAMIAGASSAPALGPAVVSRMEPWVRFTSEQVRRVLAGSPMEQLVSPDDLAFSIVAMYLGMEMLTSLDGDTAHAESLFSLLGQLVNSFRPLVTGS